MAANSLHPGYVLLDYHSPYGPHKAVLPTTLWDSANLGGTLGSFISWAGPPVDAEAMIDAWVNVIKAIFLPTTTIDTATIYTMALPVSPAIPRAGKAIGVAGTSVDPLQAKAAEHHWTFRDAGYNISGLIFLDAPVGTNFDAVTITGANAAALAIIAQWTAITNGWSSRAGQRPLNFRRIVYNMNNELRKRYGMA